MTPVEGEQFLKLWGTFCAPLGAGAFGNAVKGTWLLWDPPLPLLQGH